MTTVTSYNTGTEYDLSDLGKSFGTVEHDGRTLYLLNDAVVENYGTNGLVRYYAKAIDEAGTEYEVAWDTTDSWDLAQELDHLLAQSDPSDAEIARIDELEGMTLPDPSDESNACDWESPVEAQVR